MTFVIILQFLYAPLLTVKECPPGRFCLPAMEANEIGHELPSLCIWRLRVNNERIFECCLRPLPFFTRDLRIVSWFGLSDRLFTRNIRQLAANSPLSWRDR